MYLTKINLDSDSRKAIDIISDCQIAHTFVMSGFPNVESTEARKELGVLYRINIGADSSSIIVQSKIAPDTAKYMKQTCVIGEPKTVNLTNYLEKKILPGATLKIIADVNAASNRLCENGHYRYRISSVDEFRNWLGRTISANGGTLIDYEKENRETVKVKRKGKKFDFYRDTVTMAVKVDNADAFITAIENGIGKNKSYGCGMMMVM